MAFFSDTGGNGASYYNIYVIISNTWSKGIFYLFSETQSYGVMI